MTLMKVLEDELKNISGGRYIGILGRNESLQEEVVSLALELENKMAYVDERRQAAAILKEKYLDLKKQGTIDDLTEQIYSRNSETKLLDEQDSRLARDIKDLEYKISKQREENERILRKREKTERKEKAGKEKQERRLALKRETDEAEKRRRIDKEKKRMDKLDRRARGEYVGIVDVPKRVKDWVVGADYGAIIDVPGKIKDWIVEEHETLLGLVFIAGIVYGTVKGGSCVYHKLTGPKTPPAIEKVDFDRDLIRKDMFTNATPRERIYAKYSDGSKKVIFDNREIGVCYTVIGDSLSISPDGTKVAFLGGKWMSIYYQSECPPGLFIIDLNTNEVKRMFSMMIDSGMIKNDWKTYWEGSSTVYAKIDRSPGEDYLYVFGISPDNKLTKAMRIE